MFRFWTRIWVLFFIFLQFDHFIGIYALMPMWGGGGIAQNDVQKLYENLKNNYYFDSCTHNDNPSIKIHFIVEIWQCMGQKCCNFREKLTEGMSSNMKNLINEYLLKIRDEINKDLQWDKHTNEAYIRKNAIALIMVQQMIVNLFGGDYSQDYRVKELQEKIKMLENGENGNLNRFFKAGISKVKYEMKPHFKAYFHESIKQPMQPIVPQEMLQNGGGAMMSPHNGNNNWMMAPNGNGAIMDPKNGGMMQNGGTSPMMAAENKIKQMNDQMNMTNSMMSSQKQPTAAEDLFQKFQKIFEKIGRNISNLFMVIQNAFAEFDTKMGWKAETALKDFLRHFEQILILKNPNTDLSNQLKKPSKNLFARFQLIFSQIGYKNFTNKTVFEEIKRFFEATETRLSQSNLFSEWLELAQKHLNDQSMAQSSLKEPAIFDKFCANFAKFASISSHSPELFYLMKNALDNLIGEFNFGKSTVPIDKFFEFFLKNVPGEILKKRKGKNKRDKPRLQQFEGLFLPFHVFPSERIYSQILKFFGENKGPNVPGEIFLMNKFLEEIEKLKKDDEMKIEAFAKFMKIVSKNRVSNVASTNPVTQSKMKEKMDAFFNHFHDAIIVAKGGMASTNCDQSTIKFIESFGPPTILPTGSSSSKNDCRKGFEQRYNDKEQFYTILAFQNLLSTVFPAANSTPPNFDEFNKFIENFEKTKSSVKINAVILKRVENLFGNYLKLDATNMKLLEMYEIVAGGTERMENELLKNGKTQSGKSAYIQLFEDRWAIKPLATSTDKKTELFSKYIATKFKDKIDDFTTDLKQFFDKLDGTDGTELLKKFLSAAERIQNDFKNNTGMNLRKIFKEKICDKFGCNSGNSINLNQITKIRKSFNEAFEKIKKDFIKVIKVGDMIETFMEFFGKTTFDDNAFKEILDSKIHNVTEDESFYAFLEFFLNFKDDNGVYLDGKGSILFKTFLKNLK